MKLHLRTSFIVLLALLVLGAVSRPAELLVEPGPAEKVSVEPGEIDIDLLYSGSRPVVRAEVPAVPMVAVRLMGHRERLELKRKGKVWGFLWLSVGDVTLEEVPVAYLLATSAPLARLVPAGEGGVPTLGYPALAAVAGADAEYFPELVKLKEREGLFGIDEGGAELTSIDSATASVTASFDLPARIPAGDYTIDVLGFENGAERRLATTTLHVEHAGLARTLRSLALEHGLLYGVSAVAVALLAGVLTGFVFGLKSGKGH